MAEAQKAEAQKKEKKRCRSRIAEEVICLAQVGTCLQLIREEIRAKFHHDISEAAVRNILARAGLSLRRLREERRARRQIQPHSPAAELAAQAADTQAVAALRAHAEGEGRLAAELEVALRAQGFRVPRRQAQRAARAALAELRAQHHGLLGLARGSRAATIVADVIDSEFVRVGDALRPRRRASWEIFRAAVKARFLAIADGLIRAEPTGAEEEGLPIWRVWLAGAVAAAVRVTHQGLKVAKATPAAPPGRTKVRGTVLELRSGVAKILTHNNEVLAIPAVGLTMRRRDTYWTFDVELVQPGDEVAVLPDGCFRMDRADGVEILQFTNRDIVHLVAWCLIGQPCWVEDGTRRWRCDLPSAQSVALLDVASLDWDEGTDGQDQDSSDVVRVRPCPGGKYRVLTGAARVAEAAAKGYEEIPAILEIPWR